MQRITVDKDLLARLHDLREPLELYAEDGRRLGMVQPDPSRDRELLRSMPIPDLSEEEMQRIEEEVAAGHYYTTAEVIAHLQQLRKQ